MKLKELYEKIEEVGRLTFSTIGENGEIHSRIAHFNGYDKDAYILEQWFLSHIIDN